MSACGLGSCSSLDELSNASSMFVLRSRDHWVENLAALSSGFNTCFISPSVSYDSSLDVYRLQDTYTGLWLVNSAGHFPYYRPESTGTDPEPEPEEVYRIGQWVNMQKVAQKSEKWHAVSYYELNEFRDQWSDLYPGAQIAETEYLYWLVRSDRYASYVLCDKYGYPYYLPKEGKTAVNTPNNYYTDPSNTYEDPETNNYYNYETNETINNNNSTNVTVNEGGSALVNSPIDVNNGIITVGGNTYYIENLVYDPVTNTYYVDAHEQYTYNETTNSYTTNNYNFAVTYNVSYTSITYIGTSEEYNKRYELYYQLPDGRSSADLTAEDLEQLSTVFADVLPYSRTADDVDMRALYHFDGDTLDSSYWSYINRFHWDTGASITYMDEGEFGGSLYLDELTHDFTVTLPNTSDLAGDFTVQFRYYQSHTEAPVLDSYLAFGEEKILQFDGSALYTGWGLKLCDLPVGSWNEICISRRANTRYYYLNGVLLYSGVTRTMFDSTMHFYFGSGQQTYKKLDELRVTRAAVYGDSNYTPSAVPFDTNLALVLPEGENGVADEVMVLTPSANNLLAEVGLSDFTTVDGFQTSTRYTAFDGYEANWRELYRNKLSLVYGGTGTEFSYVNGIGTLFSAYRPFGKESVYSSDGSVYTVSQLNSGLFLPINGYFYNSAGESSYTSVAPYASDQKWRANLSHGVTYCFSVLLSDGSYSYIVFTPNNALTNENAPSSVSVVRTVNCGQLLLSLETLSSKREIYADDSVAQTCEYAMNCISIRTGDHEELTVLPDDGVNIVYMELVQGTQPQFSVDWETAVYTSGELDGSPILAVRTNLAISGYQIGGVRPSYPKTGLVYVMVENSRITSLQQYNGSAWIAVDGRIWTGSRWVPCSSFDVFTLKDFYDIEGGSGSEYEYIYTESGFWAWWQNQWNEFVKSLLSILNKIADSIGNVSVSIENNTLLENEDKDAFDPDVYRGIVKTMRKSINFFSGFFDFVFDGVSGFIDHFSDTSSGFYGLFQLSGLGG